jgi:putative phosphoesterase
MKIGLISDTHDNLRNLQSALEILRAENVTTVVHCGDVCGTPVIRALAGFDVWVARGNMDRQNELAPTVEAVLGVGRLAWLQRPVLNGHTVAAIHASDDDVLWGLVSSGRYTHIFHGHTHRRRDLIMGGVRVINPGALGTERNPQASFCILDMVSGDARFLDPLTGNDLSCP